MFCKSFARLQNCCGVISSAREVSFIPTKLSVFFNSSSFANKGLSVVLNIFRFWEKASFTIASTFCKSGKGKVFSNLIKLTIHDVIFGGGEKQFRETLNKIFVL